MNFKIVWYRWALVAAVGVGIGALACGGDGGTGPGTKVGGGIDSIPASVQVTLSLDTLDAIGATSQASATAANDSGRTLSVTFTYTSSDVAIATVDDNGLVTAVGNGDVSITATVQSVSDNALLAIAQRATSVTVSPASPAAINPGETQQFTAEAFDANSNAISGVNFLWVSSNHNVATVDQSGLATGHAGGTVSITAAGQGEPGSASLQVTGVQFGNPSQVVFTVQPSGGTAGEAFSPAVEIELRDAQDRIVTDSRDPVTLSINNNSGSLYGTKTVNAVNGIVSFSGLWVDKVGSGYTLTASSGTLTPDESGGFDIAPAAASGLEFSTQPPDIEGNDVFTAEVRITDAYGNVVTGATEPITVEIDRRGTFGANANLFGTPTIAAVGGVASFTDLKVDVPGSGYTLSARSGTFSPASSSEFQVSLTFAQIDGGWDHTCGVTTNGSAYCWGNNGNGQLGTGDFLRDSVPQLVGGGVTFAQVRAGQSHTCGVTTTNDIYCWGYNGNGQLGIGGTSGNLPEPVLASDPTGGPVVWEQVTVGYRHTCATTSSGGSASNAYCWGYNAQGQLGTNNTTQYDIPTLVNGPFDAKRIDAGTYHTCAVADNDLAYCWGYNVYGQLGDNSVIQRNLPVQVSNTLGFAEVSTGYFHSCARRSVSPFEIYCWGYNGHGQVGNGTFTNQINEVQIASQNVWGALTAGDGYHTCMIDGNFDAFCVGAAGNGRLGNGTTTPNINVREQVLGGLSFQSLAGGSNHTCGVTSSGEVYCWGYNGSGQLGIGSRIQQTEPVKIIQ